MMWGWLIIIIDNQDLFICFICFAVKNHKVDLRCYRSEQKYEENKHGI